MIKTDKFAISRILYAFKTDSFKVNHYVVTALDSTVLYRRCEVDAFWYQRRNGITSAMLGRYSFGYLDDDEEPNLDVAIMKHTDNRYGADWAAKYDGNILSTYEPATEVQRVKMLDIFKATEYPNFPTHYEGWYRF